MLLQDSHGQVLETHSISAGLDYSAVGPEHALLQLIGRVEYGIARDRDALSAARECAASRRHPAGARKRACALQARASLPRGTLGSASSWASPAAATRTSRRSRRRPAHEARGCDCAGAAVARRGSAPAIVAFVTAGYPDRAGFAAQLAAVSAAADVVEIGVPFSDPMADGVTIQRSSRRALEQGVTLAWILESSRRAPCAPGRRSC